MKVHTVYVRFYKSFNVDYLRKYHGRAQPAPWENLDTLWEPYVKVPLDPHITAVVGANESGKSHLLTAIEKVMTGRDIVRNDFCRYSPYFTVQRGQIRLPDFGVHLVNLSDAEAKLTQSLCGLDPEATVDQVWLFRTNGKENMLYLRDEEHEGGFRLQVLKPNQVQKFSEILPHVFRIDSGIPLPESVPLHFLIDDRNVTNGLFSHRRGQRDHVLRAIMDNPDWFATVDAVKRSASSILEAVAPFKDMPETYDERMERQYTLADQLLCEVANIERSTFRELYDAIENGHDGYVNGIVQQINVALASTLNFPRWWEQDREFQLIVTPREHDLAFTIRDRTGTEYSFEERSAGLKYFLSYYVQFLAHVPPNNHSEILLMDEPDAYLSSQGQQDLLKLFEGFANPNDDRASVQVVYVTHSPFLINKNHGERIRVLEKGIGEEGTRVVRDVARNHYEPLRSSMGSFVAETVFIGAGNLIVEGLADQVLLAGAATLLRSQGVSNLETLDLNRLTIVPAGSASHIPYLVYLARGRDIEQPAVTVLLDSDQAGNDAKRVLMRDPFRRKRLLKEEFILQIGDLELDKSTSRTPAERPCELEDLVPLEICARATTTYLHSVIGVEGVAVTSKDIRKFLKPPKPVFDAVEMAMHAIVPDSHLDKVGFARAVIDDVREGDPDTKEYKDFVSNFRLLFRELGQRIREAERELQSERISARLDRAIKGFLRNYPTSARREHVQLLIDEIEGVLGDNAESDQVRIALQMLRRDHVQGNDLAEPIPEYNRFKVTLEAIKYTGRIASQDGSGPLPDESIID